MTVYILGAGGHAGVVAAALKAHGVLVAGFTDQDLALKGSLIDDIPVIGTDETLLSSPVAGVELYNGLGNVPRGKNAGLSLRRRLFEQFSNLGYVFPVLLARSAIVVSSANIGPGGQIMEGALIQASAGIGENVIVNTGAIVEHDCQVGAHCHVAPGAILCGGVTTGEECHIGAGSVVLSGLVIPGGAVIPAGAVIRRHEDLDKSIK